MTFSEVNQSLEEKEILTSTSASSRTSTTEYYSAISSDDEDFFDLPSDDTGNATPTNENINSIISTNDNGLILEKALERLENELIEDPEDKVTRVLFKTVDELMEGQAEAQKQAFELLQRKHSQLETNANYLWRMCKSMYLMAVVLGEGPPFDPLLSIA